MILMMMVMVVIVVALLSWMLPCHCSHKHGMLKASLKPGPAGSQPQRLEFFGDRVLDLAISQQATGLSVAEVSMQELVEVIGSNENLANVC